MPFHLPNNVRSEEAEQKIRAVRTDSHQYTLWDALLGQLWTPKGASSLAEMVSEQLRSADGVGAQSVRAGDIVLDSGANIGVFARMAFHLGADKIIAVEHSSENLECFRRNFASEL